MKVEGSWYPARSSACHPAMIELSADQFRLLAADTTANVNGETSLATYTEVASDAVDKLNVSDRVGSMARRIHLADGSQFETLDNDSVDVWLQSNGRMARRSLLLYRLESTWRMVALGIIVTAVFVFAGFRWGVPAAAIRIADSMPVSAHEFISKGTLATMDQWILEESQLSEPRQQQIRKRFEALVASGSTEGFEFKLHFRDLYGIPNAFALPAGDIVVTDALVTLVEAPDELDAILLHEIGHVIEKHGMRHVIEASTLTMIITLAVVMWDGWGNWQAAYRYFCCRTATRARANPRPTNLPSRGWSNSGRTPGILPPS